MAADGTAKLSHPGINCQRIINGQKRWGLPTCSYVLLRCRYLYRRRSQFGVQQPSSGFFFRFSQTTSISWTRIGVNAEGHKLFLTKRLRVVLVSKIPMFWPTSPTHRHNQFSFHSRSNSSFSLCPSYPHPSLAAYLSHGSWICCAFCSDSGSSRRRGRRDARSLSLRPVLCPWAAVARTRSRRRGSVRGAWRR